MFSSSPRAARASNWGLVEVQVLPYDDVRKAVEAARADGDREIAKLQPELQRARDAVAQAQAKLEQREAESDAASARFYRNINRRTLEASSTARNRVLAAIDELESAKASLESVEAAITSWRLGRVYFARLPEPLASVKTDADGKFDVIVKRNEPVVLAAHASRRVMNKTETYYWLVRYTLDGDADGRVFLSNDNLATSGAKESLILTPE